MKFVGFPQRIFAISLLLWLSVALGGCVYFILGGVAAVGGYAVSPDTIQGETQKEYGEVWDAALQIANIMGKVDFKSDKIGEISGLIYGTKVKINISQLTPSIVRVKVKSRKAFFPSISTAQDIYVKIMRQLDAGL